MKDYKLDVGYYPDDDDCDGLYWCAIILCWNTVTAPIQCCWCNTGFVYRAAISEDVIKPAIAKLEELVNAEQSL